VAYRLSKCTWEIQFRKTVTETKAVAAKEPKGSHNSHRDKHAGRIKVRRLP